MLLLLLLLLVRNRCVRAASCRNKEFFLDHPLPNNGGGAVRMFDQGWVDKAFARWKLNMTESKRLQSVYSYAMDKACDAAHKAVMTPAQCDNEANSLRFYIPGDVTFGLCSVAD
jgi:hypothetical protein